MTKVNNQKIRAMSKIGFIRYVCSLIAILLAIPGCATKMSLEEAKKVSVSMEETPLVKPPRRINDILAVLDQAGQYDVNITKQLKAQIAASPPSGATERELAAFYSKRGNASRRLGHMKPALDDLRLALAYSEKTNEDKPNLLLHLGETEKSAGNFQKALSLFEKSYELRQRFPTYAELIKIHIKMGDIEGAENLSHQDNISKQVEKRLANMPAKRTQKQSQWALEREVELNEIRYSISEAKGRFAEAEQYLRKRLELHHSQSAKEIKPRDAIQTRIQLSGNLRKQHRLLEAEIEARQAITEALGHGGTESDLTAKAVRSLSQIMLARNRIADAEELARAGIRILESSGLSFDSEEMCSALLLLGKILSRKEEYSEAVKKFDLVREGMNDNPDLYTAMVAQNPILMLALLKSGRLDESMRMISPVYELNRKNFGEKHAEAMKILGLRGMANAMAGNDRQAFEDFSAAMPVLMRQRGNEDGSDKVRRAILETYIDFLGRIYGSPMEKELGRRASDEAFRIAGYLSSQSTQTALGQSSARAAAAYDPELSDLVRREQDMDKQISALQETLSEALMAPPDQQDPNALNSLKTTIANLTKARNTILDEISRRFPKYANYTSAQPVTLGIARENLHPHEALISIFTGGEKTHIWAVPQKGEIRFSSIPIGKKELTQIVAHLRQALDPNPRTLGDIPAFDLMQAYDLYHKILQPVEPAWKEAKDLLVTVSGPLGNLPLSLLPTEPVRLADEKDELFANYRQVPWLIRKASVTMLPSVNALVTLRSLPEGDPTRKAFAGFGDPVFNWAQLARNENSPANAPADKETPSSNIQLASRGTKVQVRGVRITEKGNLDSHKIASAQLDGLDRLPDTAEEIRSIARVLKADVKSDIFLGKDFSQQRLQTMKLSDRRVIAFATHALVPGDLDGLDQPALALSSPAVTGEKGDGLLTTDEILKMKLNADWVVLSACNTGASEGQGAEAVSGLGKAFFYAGTRALLVSMWPVETTSAHKLVTGIFRSQEENKGLSRAQALQKSILNLIDKDTMKDNATGKTVASYAHPLFWAPFVIVGDPGKSL